MNNNLFVYGTLTNPEIQNEIIGRKCHSTPDTLEGYKLSSVKIENGDYPIAEASPHNTITGLAISVNDKELKLIDTYETDSYVRIKRRLKSGVLAWVYVRANKKILNNN